MGFHDHPGPYRSRGRVWSPCRAEQFTVRDVWPTLTTMQWIPKVPWGWKMLGNGVGNGVGFLKSHDVGKKHVGKCWKWTFLLSLRFGWSRAALHVAAKCAGSNQPLDDRISSANGSLGVPQIGWGFSGMVVPCLTCKDHTVCQHQ